MHTLECHIIIRLCLRQLMFGLTVIAVGNLAQLGVLAVRS
jgi:hypothetical protein